MPLPPEYYVSEKDGKRYAQCDMCKRMETDVQQYFDTTSAACGWCRRHGPHA